MPVELDGPADPTLAADVQRMLGALGWAHALVSIVLTDDAGIQPLNAQWRGKDSATDVLSFPQLTFAGPGRPHPGQLLDGAPVALGDVVVSMETAARQAETVGSPLAAEVRVLVAHGLCHLLGHEHDDPAASTAMAADESRALTACATAAQGLVSRAAG